MRFPAVLLLVFTGSATAQPGRPSGLPPLYDTPRDRAPTSPAPRAAGFTLVARNGPMGQALTATIPNASSARAALRSALRAAAGQFDSAPILVGAYADPRDQQMQALFSATQRGGRVTGFLMTAVENGNARAALVFDAAGQVQRSVPVLMRALAAGEPAAGGTRPASGGGGARPQPLTQTMFPDGSGTIGLAAGWRIGSSWKGIVDAAGPQGQLLILGYYQQVMTTWSGPPPAIPGYILGPYRDPVSALQSYIDSYLKGALRRREATFRLIEQAPVPSNNGRASYISYEVQVAGRAATGLAMVSTAPIDGSTWVYYMSSVSAPRERFAQDFPTLWAMWKSWSVNPAVFRERMDAALQSMRETHRLLQESYANTQQTYDRVNHAWSQTIRGVTTIEHIGTGWRGDVDTNYVDRLVRGLNEQGADWRIVPLRDLVP